MINGRYIEVPAAWESGDINADNRYIDQWYTNVFYKLAYIVHNGRKGR